MIASTTTSIRDRFQPLCASCLFQDFDEWTEAFNTWNLISTQLSPGRFNGELAIAQFGCLQFIYASSSQALKDCWRQTTQDARFYDTVNIPRWGISYS